MKIAIDTSPLLSGHKARGTGFYLEHLKNSLLANDSETDYIFFTNKKEIPQDIDIVHYPYFEPFFLSLPLRKHFKTVVTVHDLTPLVFPNHFPAGLKGMIKWRIQRAALQQVDAVITDSEASKKDIINIAGIPEDKISVIYLAAGEEFRKIQDSRFKIQDLGKKYAIPEKFVLYVGDVTWNKNLPRLIKAIQEINVTLVMVGKALTQENIDSTNEWNKDLVEVNKLAKDDRRIIKLGFVPQEDLVMLYNTAAVTVMPSLYEGFGLPVIEAMSCGCPVVTTRQSSLPEIAGDTAWYVDPKDISSIANGIGEVYFNGKLQKELSHKGFERAKLFTWKKTAEQTMNVYEKIGK